ncbi:MAG: hypothetical protein M3Y81_16680 [Chloroflexota bacterium]|nr:hypothetical protein [Chloroflexota bacterium]
MATLSTPLIQVAGREEKASSAPSGPGRPWWYQAARYVAAGIRLCRRDTPGLVTLVGLFMLPPLAAVIVGSQPGPVAYWVATVLPWITITFGNIAIVLAIEAIDAGQAVIPARILPSAIRWFPRYIWTNGITTALFWGLFTPLQWGLNLEAQRLNWPSFVPLAFLVLPMLIWHVHLVFATYAAIVDDHPGIRSVLISIGLTRSRWLMVAAAFAGSVMVEAPIVGPLYFMILFKIANPLVAEGFTWALIMLMRPIFVATLHEIYEDYRPALALVPTCEHSQSAQADPHCLYEPPCPCCARSQQPGAGAPRTSFFDLALFNRKRGRR